MTALHLLSASALAASADEPLPKIIHHSNKAPETTKCVMPMAALPSERRARCRRSSEYVVEVPAEFILALAFATRAG